MAAAAAGGELRPAAEVRDFFGRLESDRLGNQAYFPPEIAEFLEEERRVLEHLLPTFSLLVEVACGTGRYLELAAAKRISYFGIDVVERRIEAGRRAVEAAGLPADQYRFRRGDAETIADVLDDLEPPLGHDALVLFPFSILSALSDLDGFAAQLWRLEAPFLASLYRPTSRMTAGRLEYYRRCGFHGITSYRTRHGVWLATADGLRTVAYDLHFLDELWLRHGLDVETAALSHLYAAVATRPLLSRHGLAPPAPGEE